MLLHYLNIFQPHTNVKCIAQTEKMSFILFILLISAYGVELYQPDNAITKCPKQCACNTEYMADLPLMKWLTIPLNKYWQQNNDSLNENQVWENNEEIQLQRNPLIYSAFCVFQHNANSIESDEFAPYLEALTVLHGPDTMNETIEFQLSSFHDLLALDIQGYQKNINSSEYSEIFLTHNALLELDLLEYLNIQYVRLIPDPNSKNKEIPKAVYEYLQTINGARIKQNLTFVLPDEPEIIPYHEFKTQSAIITTFSHLSHLQFLRLYHCKLETITWEMFEGLKELKTLSLEGNEIANIPEFAFYGMPNLKILILSNNKLTVIESDSLAGLFDLEHLDLSRNQLQYLSDNTFAPFPRLYSLDIRHNPVSKIYASTFEVANMTKVLFLGNENNALILQSNSFNGLDELEKLLITGLNVSNLENSLLKGAPKLKYLKLEGKIDDIHFDAFSSSPLLETLILKNCTLRSISMDAFYGLINLKHLDLSDNRLQSLLNGVLDELESLQDLVLSNNKLTTLPWNIFNNLINIKMIRLNENPWHCSCKLAQWPAHVVNKMKQVKMVEKCNYGYDKSPCVFEPEEYYVYNRNIGPKCNTPLFYEDWNVLHVVQKKLNCKQTKLSKSRKSEPKIHENSQVEFNTKSFENEDVKRIKKGKKYRSEDSKIEQGNTHIDDVNNSLSNENNTEKKLNGIQDL